MSHNATLITTLAAGLGLALIFGFIAARVRLPALVGYLIAGIVIGPHTPGFVADMDMASQLAEIGVMLLMFGVGLHFSLHDLLAVRKIALPGAPVGILVGTALGGSLAISWGWPWDAAVVFGLALSVASTVVLMKALESHNLMDTVNGRIAVGWLIVEDLVMVLVLVLLPPLAALRGTVPGGAEQGLFEALGWTFGRVIVFVAFMLVVGRRLFPAILWQVARTGSRELFTLCVIATALGIAYGSSQLFGVSFALGAFFAGMMLRESKLSYRAAEESLPLRDAFSVLFFVSVGMLFDPRVMVHHPLQVLGVMAVIVLGKSLTAFTLVTLFRYPLNTALTVAVSLAQIGEFSFILAGLGVSLGLLPVEGQQFILAGSLMAIAGNPLLFRCVQPLQRWIRRRSRLARLLERPDDPLAELPAAVTSRYVTGHVVLVGYGEVGRLIGEALTARRIHLVVAEQNRELVERLRGNGIHAVAGDASDSTVLIQAHVIRAHMLVIAVPDMFQVRQMIATARILNPKVAILVRTYDHDGTEMMRQENITRIFLGDQEIARNMIDKALEAMAAEPAEV